MRPGRFAAAIVLCLVLSMSLGAATASSNVLGQADPISTQVPEGIVPGEGDEETEGGRPWWRLVILVPAALLIGAATVGVRRVARDRGLTGTN